MTSYYITGKQDGRLVYLRHQETEGPRWTTIRAQRARFASWDDADNRMARLLLVEYWFRGDLSNLCIRRDK